MKFRLPVAAILCNVYLLSFQISFSQDNVGIGTATPDPSAILELNNGAGLPKGFLIPRLTTIQRDAITLPAPSLLIYNTTNTRFEYNAGTAAIPLWSANFTGLSGTPWTTGGNIGTTSLDFLGTTDAQDLIFKTNSIERARFTSGGNMLLKSGATASEFQLFEPSGSGTNYTAFKAGAQAADITYTLPAAQGVSGSVLSNDGLGNLSWSATSGVMSVGLSMPSIFTVTNSPVTSTGTLTASFNTQTANTIFAGPSTGAAAIPTFRSLVAADIPGLDASKITTGILPIARGGTNSGTALNNNRVLISSGGAIVEAPAGTAGQIFTSNGAAAPSWQDPGAVSFGTLTGGTNTTAAMVVGSGATLSPTGTGTITANQYVGSGSTTNAVDLATAEVAGILPVSSGGTGVATVTGILVGNGTSALVGRTLTGTTNQISITNGNGTAGNPTVAIATNPVIPGTGSLTAPTGTTAQRPAAPANGMMRYNTTLGKFEYYENGSWNPNVVSGTGTANYVSKFTAANTLANSTIYDNGTSVGLNTASPNSSAILEMNSTTQGFLPPRMSGSQRQAISPPFTARGLIVYQTDTIGVEKAGAYIWDGTSWGLLLVNAPALVSVVRKSTDQSRTSYGDDNELQFPLLGNDKWAIEGLIVVQNSSSQGGITFGFEAPTGCTFKAGFHSNQDNAAGFIGGYLTTNNQTASFKTNTSGDFLIIFVKILVENGATAGNIKLRWNSFNAGTSTVKSGSYFTGARAN